MTSTCACACGDYALGGLQGSPLPGARGSFVMLPWSRFEPAGHFVLLVLTALLCHWRATLLP